MAAITKRLLHLRPSSHPFTRPYSYTRHHFSSSSSDHDDTSKPQSPPTGAPSQTPQLSGSGSTNDIYQRLAKFRSMSGMPPPLPSGDNYISLQELYEKNLKSKGESSAAPSDLSAGGGKHTFKSIREMFEEEEEVDDEIREPKQMAEVIRKKLVKEADEAADSKMVMQNRSSIDIENRKGE